jgi:hypothetical protein
VARALPRPVDDRLRRWSFEIRAAEDPRTVGKRVDGVDLPAFGGERVTARRAFARWKASRISSFLITPRSR